MNREEMESVISRTAIGCEGMNRKEFNQHLIKAYGSEMRKLLAEFWSKRYLTVNAYKEVNVTGRWADYSNSKRYAIQDSSSKPQNEAEKL